jgi:hypothetical protein
MHEGTFLIRLKHKYDNTSAVNISGTPIVKIMYIGPKSNTHGGVTISTSYASSLEIEQEKMLLKIVDVDGEKYANNVVPYDKGLWWIRKTDKSARIYFKIIFPTGSIGTKFEQEITIHQSKR